MREEKQRVVISGTIREPVIPELVIPDLIAMKDSGNYDANVLLWLQDAYVDRAIKEHMGQLRALHQSLNASGASSDEIQRERMRSLVAFTRATYSTEKAGGRGADLSNYIEAAKTFYEAEAARFGVQLNEVAEYIKKALENGEQPDLERLSRHSYVSIRRIHTAAQQLEGLSGKPAAQAVAAWMRQGVENITFVTVGDQPTNVGRLLLKAVEQIIASPEKYIEYRDPNRIAMPEVKPWDFEPIHRQGDYFGL